MEWMERWFVPWYGDTRGQPDKIYAPDLEYAFKLARVMWPTATTWECLGRADGEGLVA